MFATALVGDISGLKELIERYPDCVHDRNSVGETPLHKAGKESQAKAIEVLVAHGAEVDARDDFGITPLMRVALGHNQHAVEAAKTPDSPGC